MSRNFVERMSVPSRACRSRRRRRSSRRSRRSKPIRTSALVPLPVSVRRPMNWVSTCVHVQRETIPRPVSVLNDTFERPSGSDARSVGVSSMPVLPNSSPARSVFDGSITRSGSAQESEMPDGVLRHGTAASSWSIGEPSPPLPSGVAMPALPATRIVRAGLSSIPGGAGGSGTAVLGVAADAAPVRAPRTASASALRKSASIDVPPVEITGYERWRRRRRTSCRGRCRTGCSARPPRSRRGTRARE